MRMTWLLGLICGTLITFVLFWGLQPAPRVEADGGNFRRKVAGSFLADVDLEGLPPLMALATLTAEGGLVATDTDDFGFGVGFGFHSPKHGAWARTGSREITAPMLEFAYDPVGTLTTIFKLVFVVEFDSDFLVGVGVVTFDAFLPSQDPLDPEEEPVASGGGTVTFRRIVAESNGDGDDDDDDDDD